MASHDAFYTTVELYTQLVKTGVMKLMQVGEQCPTVSTHTDFLLDAQKTSQAQGLKKKNYEFTVHNLISARGVAAQCPQWFRCVCLRSTVENRL